MAEEKAKNVGKMGLKVILGIVLLVLGVLAIVVWWQDLLVLIKGAIGIILILAGVVSLAIAKE